MSIFFFPPALLLAAAFLWLAQGILWKQLWGRRLLVQISFCQDHAAEGEEAALTEVISNRKPLPLPALHVKFHTGKGLVFPETENAKITDQSYRSDIFSCMPWQQIRRQLRFQCSRRGYYSIQQVQLTSYDLLWSSAFTRSDDVRTSMYVYPRSVSPERLCLPLCRLAGDFAARRALFSDPFELSSIRNYQRGDSVRSINWKASAKAGDLKVNVFSPSSSWRVTILLDQSGYRLWDDERLKEELIRLCAGLAESLINRQIPVAIRTNGRDCITRTSPQLDAGSGSRHLQAVMELLSRLEMQGQAQISMETMISSLFQTDNSFDFSLYVLLSLCQTPSMLLTFQQLCQQSPGSQWILPLRPGDPCTLHSDQIYPWEVPYGTT